MARALAALLLLLAIGARAGEEDVITVSGGLSQLEELVKKHPFLVVEVRRTAGAGASAGP